MKLSISILISVFAPIAVAQTAKPAMALPADSSGQVQTFLPQSQMKILCAHNHKSGSTESTVLYRAHEVEAEKMPKSLRVGRLTALVVHFTHVNTFCYSYAAGVTKETAFYGGAMPSPLKPFIGGGLGEVFIPKGATRFETTQSTFAARYAAFSSLGKLAIKISQDFKDVIKPEKTNSEIRTDLLAKLKKDFGYTDRDVTKEDLALRQSELQGGIGLLTKDLEALRDPMVQPDATSKTSQDVIKDDEEALSGLQAQFANYAAAISNLDEAMTAQDDIERTVTLDAKYDEFEVTAAVTPIAYPGSPSVSAMTPAALVSKVLVEVTGGPVLDFSVGLVATSPVSHDYYLGGAKGVTVVDGGATSPSILPMAFVEYFTKPAPGVLKIGPALGVDLTSGHNFCFGLALVRGGAQRISLVGGFSMNQITELNGDKVGQTVLNGKSIQTKSRYLGGYFVGLTYNFGG